MALPLEGVLVLELSHIVAGPFCGGILADYGADLIKIEAPGVGDRGRTSPPFIPDTNPPVSGSFYALGRSRRGLALNLKDPEGKRVFRELAARADVVLENFTPGTMDRLGLGYAALKQVNPRLVYAAISGFGQLEPFVGPYSDRPANNAIAQAMGGLMELTGEPDGPPGYVGATVGDTIPGLWAALGIVLALRQRDASGVGQFVDVAMYDSLAAMCYRSVVDYSATGVAPSRGNEGWTTTFTGVLKSGQGHIAVSMWGNQPEKWNALWERMGHPEYWNDPRYDEKRPGAKDVEPHVRRALETWLADKAPWEGTQALLELGFSAGPVQTAREVHDCPHLAARQALVEVEVEGRRLKVPRSPVRLSDAEDRRHTRGPRLGEHTAEVLADVLGYTPEQVAALRATGVC